MFVRSEMEELPRRIAQNFDGEIIQDFELTLFDDKMLFLR